MRSGESIEEAAKGSNWPVAAGSRTVANLYGQNAQQPNTSSKESNTVAAPRRFDIAPGPLESVLTEFRHATGFQVTVSNDHIQSLQSPGVTGVLTPSEALEKLLNGTGVSFRFADRRTVALELSGQRQSIHVTDHTLTLCSPKYRGWGRFVRTGEAFGVVGQTIAGLASGARAFLVRTGVALSLNRLRAWRKRRRMGSTAVREVEVGAAQ